MDGMVTHIYTYHVFYVCVYMQYAEYSRARVLECLMKKPDLVSMCVHVYCTVCMCVTCMYVYTERWFKKKIIRGVIM